MHIQYAWRVIHTNNAVFSVLVLYSMKIYIHTEVKHNMTVCISW